MSLATKVVAAQGAAVLAGACAWYAGRDSGLPSKPAKGAPIRARNVIEAANSIAAAAGKGFCCTASAGSDAPEARIMDVHGPAKDGSLRYWLVSRRWTRKAAALAESGRCSLAFHDPRHGGENGYAVLYGGVREVVEPAERERRWKSTWSYFHVGGAHGAAAIWEFTPDRVEVVSHAHGVARSWQPVELRRGGGGGGDREGIWELQPPRPDPERAARA